jgi:hypothetical protein
VLSSDKGWLGPAKSPRSVGNGAAGSPGSRAGLLLEQRPLALEPISEK